MKAVLLEEYGGPEKLHYTTTDLPPVGDNEVLVRVRATSINPVDYKLRSGALRSVMPLEFPAILGRDLVGEVEDVGQNVTGFAKGMRVMALANGTYAECATAKADLLATVPDSLSYVQAAALPLVTLTGAQLIEQGVKPRTGETVLVTGALGGVGRSAVHVARKHGARVLAGVRAAEREQAKRLGADGIVAIDEEQEVEKLFNLDAIADTVGGPTIERLLKALRSGGVIGSVVGAPNGAKSRNIRVEPVWTQPDASRLYELADDAARGEFEVPVAKVMKLADVVEAHRIAESHGVGGKIILVP
jgi:NADPH:quinone reductase-like Zn-dependent oxidoreductase